MSLNMDCWSLFNYENKYTEVIFTIGTGWQVNEMHGKLLLKKKPEPGAGGSCLQS
jgi:hypothetical protein